MSRSNRAVAGDADPLPRWLQLGSLPVVAAILVALNGLYILFVAFGNITDYGTNQPFVEHVLSMDTTNFGAGEGQDLDSDVMWRAIDNRTLQNAAYVLIIVWESLTAIVLLGSLFYWVTERGRGYRIARAASSMGLVMLLLLFMGGFIAIGGEWFQMWKSSDWNGLDSAFRVAVLAFISLVLIHIPSSHWNDMGPGSS
ncbi:MAG TPA: DUF2165 domain-containing protein [Thermomicrobiales bacterium]|nr:DUF2165 domain-containing protein [Thermomicrobiales bacterium]